MTEAVSVNPVTRKLARMRSDWHQAQIEIDRPSIIDKIRHDSDWTAHFAFMTLMSAGIAILGLLQNSVAVIIGAMLVAPLMGPILALGFAIATADFKWMKESALTLLGGIALALLLCALIVKISPIEAVTTEIAARTRPTLFDLAVALFSALAGAYAIIRGREGTIIGVAIATALMPPLAVVAFGFATGRWSVFGGALLLFFTNFMTIALSAAIVARIYGFSARLSPDQTRWQTIVIVGAFVLLALPLGYTLRQIAWEATVQRQAGDAIQAAFANKARTSGLSIDFDARPIVVDATVLTPVVNARADDWIARRLAGQLDAPVTARIVQYQVSSAAETARKETSTARERDAATRAVVEQRTLSGNLATLAGVSQAAVLIDSGKRQATVRVKPLVGASLETYRALERRARAAHSAWGIDLVPPLVSLPALNVADGAVVAADQADYDLVLWAAGRTGVPVGVIGSGEDAEALVARLRIDGVDARRTSDAAAPKGDVTLRWITAEDTGGED